jgi:hypothetical protein
MQPGFVFAILGVTLTFTTTIYYLRIPQDLSAGLSNKSSEGYWGKPNAEFDWCEFNYLSSFYVAEPVNSFSMMSFFIVVFRLQRHFRTVLRTCPHAPRLLLEIALVAAGSFAFHATLRYRLVTPRLHHLQGLGIVIMRRGSRFVARCSLKPSACSWPTSCQCWRLFCTRRMCSCAARPSLSKNEPNGLFFFARCACLLWLQPQAFSSLTGRSSCTTFAGVA